MKTTRELSQIIKVNKRVIRYYKEKGLIQPKTTNSSGYDLYEDEIIEKVLKIELYRKLGFEVRKIKEVIDEHDYLNKWRLDEIIKNLENTKEKLIFEYNEKIAFAKNLKETI